MYIKNAQIPVDIRELRAVAAPWKEAPTYYEPAEADDWLDKFWRSDWPFRPLLDKLNRECLVELACGRGRHAARALSAYDDMRRICLVDIFEENIEFCRKRFAGDDRVSVVVNNGFDFQPLPDGYATGIYSYDAMVHFEYDTVISYLRDAARLLVPGGRAFFHHSNYDKTPGTSFHDNPGWRNYMSVGLFSHIAQRSGFKVIEQVVLDWTEPRLDCLTLLERV